MRSDSPAPAAHPPPPPPAQDSSRRALAGRRIVVTAGPTWVWLDAVRYLGNRSSGRTGIAIARACAELGAEVDLALGPVGVVRTPTGVRLHRFESFHDLHSILRSLIGSRPPEAIVHAAAVSDYEPVEVEPSKLPSAQPELVLRLRPTVKLSHELRHWAPGSILVTFKLEVDLSEDDLLERARESGQAAGADYVVANDLGRYRAGRHPALVLRCGEVVARPGTTRALAEILAARLAADLRPPVSPAPFSTRNSLHCAGDLDRTPVDRNIEAADAAAGSGTAP